MLINSINNMNIILIVIITAINRKKENIFLNRVVFFIAIKFPYSSVI